MEYYSFYFFLCGKISIIVLGFNALIIRGNVGLMGFTIMQRTKLVKNCVKTEAIAAPSSRRIGMRARFKATLITAPERLIIQRYFCFFSARIHTFLTDPIYEKAEYHGREQIFEIVLCLYFPLLVDKALHLILG